MNKFKKTLKFTLLISLTFFIVCCSSDSPVDKTMNDVLVKTVVVNGSDITDGQSKQLSVVVLPNNADNREVTWSVSNTTVATISDSGVLTPLDNGTITVTAAAQDASGISAEKTIKISGVSGPPVLVQSITVTGTDIMDGSPQQLSAQVLPTDATNKVVIWSVSDPLVAEISNAGLLNPIANGTVTVKATATDGTAISGELVMNISGVTIVYQTILKAENMLLWQRNNGGWPKEPYNDFSGYDRVQTAAEISEAESTKDNTDTTIDNGHTYGEIRDLLTAYRSTNNPKYLAAAEKGIDYLLEAQHDNGGWPQYYPDKSFYRHQITYNDNAMGNVMLFIRDIFKQQNNLDLVDASYIDKAKTAFDKGIDVILKTQIIVNGKKTAWCAQHDEVTLEPATARTYELPSISGSESANVVNVLMKVEQPSSEVIDAVKSAIAWFEAVKIVGYKTEKVYDPIYTERGFNVVVVESPGSVMWARFYDLNTNLPFFCDRDGIKKDNLADIGEERRTGYAWYGNWPDKLISSSEYASWNAKYGN